MNKLSSPWIKQQQTIKLLFYVTILLTVAIAALSAFLFYLFPLKEKTPVFVTFKDGSSNFVEIRAVGQKQGKTDLQLIRHFLTSYIIDRETIDKRQKRFYSKIYRKQKLSFKY